MAKTKQEKGLEKTSIKVGVPIKCMLAIKEDTILLAFERVGLPTAVEYKYDGFRMQVHKDGDKVTVTDFSLDLKSKGMGATKSLAVPATVPYTLKTELVGGLQSKVKVTFSWDKTKVTVEPGSILKAKACSKGANNKEQCSDISIELWK